MNTRTIALFSIGLAGVLFAASQTQAQPGKGFGKRAGADADIKKLETDLENLLEKVKETKAKIARAKEADKGKGGKGYEGMGKWKGGWATWARSYESKKKETAPATPASKWKGGWGTWGKYYEAKGKETAPTTPPSDRKGRTGAGSSGGASSSVEARIDRLIRELEQIRTELKAKKK
jgi:outer membrane murein-binding lipoprotein Lpp